MDPPVDGIGTFRFERTGSDGLRYAISSVVRCGDPVTIEAVPAGASRWSLRTGAGQGPEREVVVPEGRTLRIELR